MQHYLDDWERTKLKSGGSEMNFNPFKKKQEDKPMARNLMNEYKQKQDQEKVQEKKELVFPDAPKESDNIKVITWEELVANNLMALQLEIRDLRKQMQESFKKVGVDIEKD